MKFKLNSLRTKLIILCLSVLLVPMIVVGISSYIFSKDKLDDSGKLQLKQNVRVVIGMINLMNDQVEAGTITLEDAQEKIRQELLGVKDADNKRPFKKQYIVGETGYPWAVNEKAISVMNPANEGTDLTNVKTQDGVMMGKELLRLGEEGGGYLTYKWKLANSEQIATKVSYVEAAPHWGWIVGAGVYMTEFNSGAKEILYLVSLIAAIAIILGAAIVSFVASRFTKPILLVAKKLNTVANGDFTVEPVKIKSKDEVGELAGDFNNMVSSMRQLISQVHLSTEKVAASSKELTMSAEQTSKTTEQITNDIQESASGADEQQSMLQKTMTSLEEISVGVQRIAESSSLIAESSADTTETAGLGEIAVQNTVKQMNSISISVHESDAVIKLLDQKTQKINEMLSVITDIANQTNLLALNAAIEAARAGEHGRGFSVVAQEVRKLADQSNQSSGQIANLIDEMQQDMSQSIQTMGRVKEEVRSGLQIANETERRFNDIVMSTGQISQQIEELASITQEISASVQEVSVSGENVANIAKIASGNSQNIAASAEEQLASMEEVTVLATTLSKMAEDLQELAVKFKF
jgi:methyl-accepting chemotaxis protein